MNITSILVIFSALIAATFAVPGYIQGYSSIGWPGINDANYKYAYPLGGYSNYLYGGYGPYGNGYGYGYGGYGANGYVANYGAHYAPKYNLYGYGGGGGYLSGIYGYNPYYYKK